MNWGQMALRSARQTTSGRALIVSDGSNALSSPGKTSELEPLRVYAQL